MTPATPPAVSESQPVEVFERIETVEQLVDKNWDLLEEAMRKALDGRVYDEEKERARQGWHTQANKHLDQQRKLLDLRESLAQGVEVAQLKEEVLGDA